MKLKNKSYHQYMKRQRKTGAFQKTEDLRSKISNLITKSMEKYYHAINLN